MSATDILTAALSSHFDLFGTSPFDELPLADEVWVPLLMEMLCENIPNIPFGDGFISGQWAMRTTPVTRDDSGYERYLNIANNIAKANF